MHITVEDTTNVFLRLEGEDEPNSQPFEDVTSSLSSPVDVTYVVASLVPSMTVSGDSDNIV